MNAPRKWSMTDPADALLLLAAGVEEIEEGGRDQMLGAAVIPAEVHGATDEDLLALGFELGDLVDGDRLFRHACYPHGWTRRPSEDDHRTVYLVDEHGHDRAYIWYKAAAYDRKASMVLLGADADE